MSHQPRTVHRLLRNACSTGLPGFLALTAIVLAFYGFSTDFFQDESHAVWLSKPGWHHIAEFIAYEPGPPFYYGLLAVWIDLAGDSEFSIRALSGLCYVLSLVSILWLGRYIFRRDELIAVLVAVACSPKLLATAGFGRMFALMFLESCVALLAFAGLFLGRARGRGMVILLAVANLAGMLTHYYFTFLVLAQAIVFIVFVRHKWASAAFGLLLPVALFLAAWGPVLFYQVQTTRFTGTDTLTPPLTWSRPWSEMYEYYRNRWFFLVIPSLLILILVARSGGRLRLSRWPALKAGFRSAARDRRLQAFGIVWVTTFFGPFLAAMVAGPAFFREGKSYVPTLLPFVVVLAVVIRRGDLRLKTALAFLVLAVTLAAEIRARNKVYHENSDHRASIQLLKNKAAVGDIVVCLDNYVTLFYYYMSRAPGGKQADVLAYPAEFAKHPGWYNEQATLRDRGAYVDATRAYAVAQAQDLAAHPGQRLWLIDSVWNPETSRIVTEAFDSSLRRVDSIRVQGGTGYAEYIVYEAPSLAAARP